MLVQWYGKPVYKENGKLDYFFGLGIDITEQRNAEQALKEREILLNSILNNTDNGILVLDAQKRVVFYNDRYVKIWELDTGFLDTKPRIRMSSVASLKMVCLPPTRQKKLLR